MVRTGIVTAASGVSVWGIAAWLVGPQAVWESPLFWTVGVALLALTAFLAGLERPRGRLLWGMTTVILLPFAWAATGLGPVELVAALVLTMLCGGALTLCAWAGAWTSRFATRGGAASRR